MKTTTCQPCAEPTVPESPIGASPSVSATAVGTAGAGPQREGDRRRANRNAHIEQRWGRLAPVAKFLSDDPQHIRAFDKGADGERRLAVQLQRDVGDRAILLHSRRIPRDDVDHLAIAASGVFVIDAKNYEGRVETRDVGGWRTIDRRLYVGGRDKSKLVDGMGKQVAAVRTSLVATDHADVPIRPVLCFTNSDWGWFAKPIVFGDVICLWAKKLCELIRQPGPLQPDQRDAIARVLSIALPPIS